MHILFARHGNTFGPGERVIWVGPTVDLPLAAKGQEQARRLGRTLMTAGVTPRAVFCGTLRRTRDYAEIVIEELGAGLAPVIDRRLDEIDYGRWTGLTSQEITAKFGLADELARWDADGTWPDNAGWGTTEAEVRRRVRGFLDNLAREYGEDDVLLAVTSNGLLRYFASVTSGRSGADIEKNKLKMKTGNIGKVRYKDGCFRLEYWDVAPGEIKS